MLAQVRSAFFRLNALCVPRMATAFIVQLCAAAGQRHGRTRWRSRVHTHALRLDLLPSLEVLLRRAAATCGTLLWRPLPACLPVGAPHQ